MNFSKKLIVISIFTNLIILSQAQKPYISKVWSSDNKNGTYKNPIIDADYSDPDVIRVGNDFYMVASSFNCSPAIPILHSRDLVNWKIINYGLNKQIPTDTFNKPQHGKGVWAPAIRFHKGEFYIYYPDPDFGIYMIKSKNIFGKFSAPKLVLSGKGIIDPCPFWDDDGKTYLITAWAGSRAGVKSLLTLYQMNSEGTMVIDEGKHIFDGHIYNETVEGPKLYKRNGYYYVFAPAGGVATGWQLVLRSKNIYGIYEEKKVLEQGKTKVNGPHQGAWINTNKGEDWFIHFQDKDAYGRVVHLQPMQWKNDWPIIGVDNDNNGIGEPVEVFKKPLISKSFLVENPLETDEFDIDTLGLQWQWNANYQIQWSALLKGYHFLRLFAINQQKNEINLSTTPNLLMQKFPAPNFTATTKITLNTGEFDVEKKKAALVIYGEDYAYIGINKKDNKYAISYTTCSNMLKNNKETTEIIELVENPTIYFRVKVTEPKANCLFSYSIDGLNFKPIDKTFTAKAGKWVGAKMGLFCIAEAGSKVGGFADIDWFRVTE